MPELPEVETVRKGLSSRLKGFQIKTLEISRDRLISSPGGVKDFTEILNGAIVGSWERRGKYLIASLLRKCKSPGQQVIASGYWGVHLRMTGHFQWYENSSPPCSHTRARFWNTFGQELRFVDIRSFGQMWSVPPGCKPEVVITGLKKLGPEPFSKEFNAEYLRKKLKGSKRPIKSALLDQSLVAGAGNIYADESLFSAHIRPQTPSGQLGKAKLNELCKSLIEVLTISIGKGGTTFSDFRNLEGLNGNYGGQAWVYRRNGQSCRVCNTKIEKITLSGRSAHWCPKCQE